MSGKIVVLDIRVVMEQLGMDRNLQNHVMATISDQPVQKKEKETTAMNSVKCLNT